jgi:hypothetical protein
MTKKKLKTYTAEFKESVKRYEPKYKECWR